MKVILWLRNDLRLEDHPAWEAALRDAGQRGGRQQVLPESSIRRAHVRRWVPELAKLPDKYLHAPWTAPEEVLTHSGIVLGRHDPAPIVDHTQACQAALAAYDALKVAKE